jgi:hypothetical protein
MSEAKIIGYESGFHNQNIDLTIARLAKDGVYKDLSTIVIIPALNQVATKAASSWWNLMFPPNGKVVKLFAQNMEVGEAYSQTIQSILDNPDLQNYKYIVTIEADNVVPPDGVVKLLAKMEEHPELACIGGLYYTKGFGGVPQIWGDVRDPVLNFRPMPPVPGQLVECCGTGMGFNAFRLNMFKDPKLRKPWFKTTASMTEGCFSQDLWFATDARKHGYRFAVDCSILVGHVDMITGFVW